MTICRIKVENVKGAKCHDITENIIPNKPSLLVAPNGFGKSSITAAFSGLIPSKLKLDDDHLHGGSEKNRPKLTLDLQEPTGGIITLVADDNKNELAGKIDVFVINSRLEAKAIKRNIRGFTAASASLKISEVVLVDKIPETAHFKYRVAKSKQDFGVNGKCLLNIEFLFKNSTALAKLSEEYDLLARFSGVRVKKEVIRSIDLINQQTGDATAIRQWIEANCLSSLKQIQCLNRAASILLEHTREIKSETDAILCAYQICTLYSSNPKEFKRACAYAQYNADKEIYKQVISSFDTTWKSVKPKETNGQLVVDFPGAMHISNGQRDSLTFAAMTQRIKSKIGKRDVILIIDEVFDYLDDANLTAVQYYISNLIESVKANGNRIYPLIFTHLNPIYFKNYAFGDQKVYFIDKRTQSINADFRKIILKRNDDTIKAAVESHFIHYHPNDVDLQNEFLALELKKTWGKSDNFHTYISNEWEKYKLNQPGYDPFAVCCFVRVKLEKIAYQKIADPQHQDIFIRTHKTRKKLEYARSIGVEIPETAFLLGIIYNEGLHVRDNVDNSSPVVAKLENLVIRKMAIEATEG
jgi:energy-coupling factor transporter ATP-binding protein EcfA2